MFVKTLREAPADEVSKNAQLLIRAGFIYKEMAGVYSYLPLGLSVIKKIEEIIREEMNAIGGQEMKTSVLQDKAVWEKSGRWSDKVVDNWFKTELKNGGAIGLSFTNEEPITNIMRSFVHSYKDLPVYAYDFKDIFRNETRAKSGIMRGREFYWKALYSFCADESEHNKFYEQAKQAYLNIFNRCGIGDKTYLTFASGGTFSEFSHEFQTITDAGEDTIYINEKQKIAINQEVLTDENLVKIGALRADLVEKRAVEVGNIFSLANKFSDPLDLFYTAEDGRQKSVYMGCYGIGLGRLMGTVAEVLSDEKGIIWPENIAPARVYLINIGDETAGKAEEIYNEMISRGVEVIWDDRDVRPGEKFADADLMGIPHRVVVSPKLTSEGLVEYKSRALDTIENLTIDALFARMV